MEPTELKTSIGVVYIEAATRNEFSIQGPFVSPLPAIVMPERVYPHVWLYFDNDSGQWAPGGMATYYSAPGESALIPAELLDELSKLGIEWAEAHPENFARAARADFDDLIGYITQDTFNELLRIFEEAQGHFRQILSEPEFELHASIALRRRIKQEAQRIRVMRLQIAGAAKAINTLAGRRPLGPDNQSAAS